MSFIINLYIPGQSWLHRTDPRVKLLFVGSALLLLILFKNVWLMVATVLLLHLLHGSAGTPAASIRFIWRTLLPVSLLMLSLRVLFYPVGEPFWQWGMVQLTAVAIAQGLVLALRIIAMAFAVFAWLYTTDQPAIIQSLVRLHVPYSWALVLALALRYIPTFQAIFTMISEAQQARGLNVAQQKGFQRVRGMMPIFVAMIITSLRASNQLAMALESRAFGVATNQRTYLHDLQARSLDYVLAALLLLLLVGFAFLYWRYGFGAHPIQVVGSELLETSFLLIGFGNIVAPRTG